ncbi:pancreatic lipase-related protein 2-like [Copidosoma floridanum]|uniref:pancreatic lipase-related protein 2-like n=1 Tax=Copidosoma floridanum TaxID=29053 RepID=UPI0006C9AA3D|nr:pancreatic lipase-related protein 2-like [Copidosoma floridanum]
MDMVSSFSSLPLLLFAITTVGIKDASTASTVESVVKRAATSIGHQQTVPVGYDGPSDLLMEEILLESFVNSASMAGLDALLDPSTLSIPEWDVGFYLYTRQNPSEPAVLSVSEPSGLNRSYFDATMPTKILIHGWTDSGSSSWMHDMRRNYLDAADYNVILVDWSSGSFKEYLVAARLTKLVGDYVARFVELVLASEGGASLESIHILGHSLGAHVAGSAGRALSGKLGRITGLDPARPDFEVPLLREPKDRLDPSDAIYVDVIHTCAGTAGFVRPIGHADFYPNGGSFRQPGCPVLSTQYCSHGRSHQFMSESITNPVGFPAVECYGWKEFKANWCDRSDGRAVHYMGEHVDKESRGVFFLETNAEPPFGRPEL